MEDCVEESGKNVDSNLQKEKRRGNRTAAREYKTHVHISSNFYFKYLLNIIP